MFEFICASIVMVALGIGGRVYFNTRDAFHPAVFMAPLFAYFYGAWPIHLNRDGGLEEYIRSDDLTYVALLNAVSILALFFAMAKNSGRVQVGSQFGFLLASSGSQQRKLYRLSLTLGAIAVAAYWYMLDNVGGFVKAYSVAKGGGYASSGYIGESILLSFPALGLLALSRQGRRIRVIDVFAAFVMASPHLLQGTFGGRRGPLFLILTMLFMSRYLALGRMPNIRQMVLSLALVGFLVAFVSSNRQYVYLGSEGKFELSRISEQYGAEALGKGNEYLAGVASVLMADRTDRFFWGYRYFVTFVIRPIPKEIWPTKYQDMGVDWILGDDEDQQDRYSKALGFKLLAGSSTGFVADVYMEFGWGAPLFIYLLGRGFGHAWYRFRTKGGFWTVLYCEMMILAIYLPTQSFSAWAHRFLIMGAVTGIAWRIFLRADSPRRLGGTRSALGRIRR